jgi:hypothetical protein
MSTQELLTTPLAETVAVVFPQRCVPPEALIGAARAVGRELLSSGCLGRVSVSFAVFKDAKSKKMLMWAEEVNLFPTPQAAFHECLSALASIPAKPLPPADPLGTLGPAPIATYPREGNSPHKSLSNSSFQQHQALVSLNRDDSFLLTFDDSSEDNNSQGQDIQFHNYETFLELNEMSLSKVNGQPLNPVPSTNVSSTGVSPLPSIHSSPRFQLGTSKAGSFKEMAALEHAISLGVTTSSSTPKGMSYVACCPLYHPGLPTVLPLAKLLRLARLKNHGYDIRTAKGDLFIPVDSLAGGVIATASVTTQGDEAVAALKFSHLLEFFASRVGRRTVLGQHEANLHSNGDDGFDRFVALQVAVEGALARFEARRQRANV